MDFSATQIPPNDLPQDDHGHEAHDWTCMEMIATQIQPLDLHDHEGNADPAGQNRPPAAQLLPGLGR